jgi:hypothetical protein
LAHGFEKQGLTKNRLTCRLLFRIFQPSKKFTAYKIMIFFIKIKRKCNFYMQTIRREKLNSYGVVSAPALVRKSLLSEIMEYARSEQACMVVTPLCSMDQEDLLL